MAKKLGEYQTMTTPADPARWIYDPLAPNGARDVQGEAKDAAAAIDADSPGILQPLLGRARRIDLHALDVRDRIDRLGRDHDVVVDRLRPQENLIVLGVFRFVGGDVVDHLGLDFGRRFDVVGHERHVERGVR